MLRKNRFIFERVQIVIGVALGLFLLWNGCAGLLAYHKAVSNPNPVPDPHVVITSADVLPDETAITKDPSYQVADTLPRQIVFPSLGVQGLIQRVGADHNGQMAVPTNVYIAGWSVQTVVPGDPGLSIIDGHVQGRYRDGIFKHLGQLKPGDHFEVEMGNLTKHQFAVIRVNTYSNAEAERRLFQKDQSIDRQLTLITCAGTYDAEAQGYTERTLVVARFVP